MFTLCDVSWGLLFPSYWVAYRRTCSYRNVAKLKVISETPWGYELELMEVAPEEGRIVVPVGMRIEATMRDIHISYVSSYRSTLT